MGQVRYDVVVDEALLPALAANTDLSGGAFTVNAAPGEYAISFTAPSGVTTDVLLVVE